MLRYLVFILLIILIQPVAAQRRITVEEAVGLAMNNQRNLKAANLAVIQQQQLLKGSAGLENPQLQFQLSPYDEGGQVGVQQTISLPAVYRNRKALQNERIRLAQLQLQGSQYELKREVRLGFLSLQYLAERGRMLAYQDSIYRYMRSEAYLDSMDRVLNKITWKKMLIFGQIFNDHKKERMWILPPLTSMIQPVAFGGARLKLAAAYRKTFSSRKKLDLEADISYGFRNQDVNGTLGATHLYNPFNRGEVSLRGGRNFEFIYPGDAWVNVLKRSNIYLNNSLELAHGVDIINGIRVLNKFEVAFRRSVADYKVGNNADSIFGISNEPPVQFDPYNATYNEIKLYFTPKLK